MTAFIYPGWVVSYPVVLFMCAQYSPVLFTMYKINDVGGCLGGVIVATWLDMRFWNFCRLDLILYHCISGTLHIITL